MRSTSFRLLCRCLLPLVLAPVLVAWSARPARTEPPAPPPRTPVEALAEGRRLAHSGEWEAAAQAYGEALADEGETGLTARFELARLYDQSGKETVAADLLPELLSRPPTSATVVRAWFLQGSVQSDLGNHEAAAQGYARYVERSGAAAAYARVEQARALAALDDVEGALAALRPLLDGAGPVLARQRALRLAGRLEETAQRPDRAVVHYDALLQIATASAERIVALDRIGALRRQLGDDAAATEAWLNLASRYPHAPEAETALGQLDEIGRPADPLTAGIVHYRRRNNQQARQLLNAYLQANGSAGPGAAAALFYLGALAERRGDVTLALENYAEAHAADPTGGLAAEALWERAGVLAGAGRTDEAGAAYALVAERFPASSRAPEAAFHAGYVVYKAGRVQDARAAWSAAMAGPDNAGAARATFWAGRAADELGDVAAARPAYAEAVRRDPTGYYGLRAAAVLAGEPRAPAAGRGALNPAPPDWAGVEGWLAAWAGPEDPRPWQALSGSEEWQAGWELLQLGWHATGSNAVALVIGERTRQPWPLYRMARALSDSDQPHLAYSAAAYLLTAAPASAPPAALAIARLAYPAPWADQVQYFADQYGVDPLLFYALMRQESAFNRRAGSSAGAFGLTQVIPSTAQEIARALGRTPFDFEDLARPAVAIQFGAYYLGAQLRYFAGNAYQALAAYNGGPGNAARWARPGGAADVDRFYEEVDYAETQLYLRIVLQNYAWYRYLYGVTAQPALTGP